MTRSLALFLCLLAAGKAVAQEDVTVQLDWKPDAQFAGILVAKEKGYYRAAGLDVTIRPAEAGMETVAEVARGPQTIGVAEADVLLVDRSKGYDIRAFATMLQTTPFALLTLKTSGLESMKSLRGKKIGLHGDGNKAIDVILRYNGMTRADVKIVDVPYTLDPLLSGEVDAMQGYIVDEAVRLELAHHPVNIIPMSENGYVSYAEVLFTSAGFLEKKPEVVLRFLRATNAGWRTAVAHPHATAEMIVARYMPDSSVVDEEASLRKSIPLLNYETHDDRLGLMAKSTWDETIAMFNTYQLVGHSVSADNLVDYSILRKLYPAP